MPSPEAPGRPLSRHFPPVRPWPCRCCRGTRLRSCTSLTTLWATRSCFPRPSPSPPAASCAASAARPSSRRSSCSSSRCSGPSTRSTRLPPRSPPRCSPRRGLCSPHSPHLPHSLWQVGHRGQYLRAHLRHAHAQAAPGDQRGLHGHVRRHVTYLSPHEAYAAPRTTTRYRAHPLATATHTQHRLRQPVWRHLVITPPGTGTRCRELCRRNSAGTSSGPSTCSCRYTYAL